MQSMKRPLNDSYAFVRLPRALGDAIDKLAAENEPPVSRAAMAAFMLREALKEKERQAKK